MLQWGVGMMGRLLQCSMEFNREAIHRLHFTWTRVSPQRFLAGVSWGEDGTDPVWLIDVMIYRPTREKP